MIASVPALISHAVMAENGGREGGRELYFDRRFLVPRSGMALLRSVLFRLFFAFFGGGHDNFHTVYLFAYWVVFRF